MFEIKVHDMNLVTELLTENSRNNIDRVVKIILEKPELYKELVGLTIEGNQKIAMRASWTLTHLHEVAPHLLKPYIRDLIQALPGFAHTGIRRNILRMFIHEPIPRKLQGIMFDNCMKWIYSKKEPIAVKANAMEILACLALEEPDLKNEIIPAIIDILPHGSVGVRAKAKIILRKLGVKPQEISDLE